MIKLLLCLCGESAMIRPLVGKPRNARATRRHATAPENVFRLEGATGADAVIDRHRDSDIDHADRTDQRAAVCYFWQEFARRC